MYNPSSFRRASPSLSHPVQDAIKPTNDNLPAQDHPTISHPLSRNESPQENLHEQAHQAWTGKGKAGKGTAGIPPENRTSPTIRISTTSNAESAEFAATRFSFFLRYRRSSIFNTQFPLFPPPLQPIPPSSRNRQREPHSRHSIHRISETRSPSSPKPRPTRCKRPPPLSRSSQKETQDSRSARYASSSFCLARNLAQARPLPISSETYLLPTSTIDH